MKEQMREAFEAWAEKELLPLDKRDSEHYRYNLTNRAWAGWKAALSAVPANHVGDSNEMGQEPEKDIAESITLLSASVEYLKSENAAQEKRIAELEYSFREWLDKTEFVQNDEHKLFFYCLGLHRADAMHLVIESLRKQVEELKLAHQYQVNLNIKNGE